MSELRMIRLRYPAVCAKCGGELVPGTEAVWDRAVRTATCSPCAGSQTEAVAAPLRSLERGTAGASAARRYERLHERREVRAKERFGRFSGLYLGLTNEPQSTRAWGTGSSGERKLGAYLDTLDDGRSLIVLHDRRVPRTRANIDHIAITRGGAFVIDAKHYKGKVQKVDKGGWFSTDLRLYVGRRECSNLIAAMSKQVEVVRNALAEAAMQESALTVTPVLCFVDAEWSLFSRPFQLDGVWVEWPKSLGQRLQAPGPLAEGQRFWPEDQCLGQCYAPSCRGGLMRECRQCGGELEAAFVRALRFRHEFRGDGSLESWAGGGDQ